jgi:hypothetical protein
MTKVGPLSNQNKHLIAEKIREISFLTYGKDRAEVEAGIMKRYQAISGGGL